MPIRIHGSRILLSALFVFSGGREAGGGRPVRAPAYRTAESMIRANFELGQNQRWPRDHGRASDPALVDEIARLHRSLCPSVIKLSRRDSGWNWKKMCRVNWVWTIGHKFGTLTEWKWKQKSPVPFLPYGRIISGTAFFNLTSSPMYVDISAQLFAFLSNSERCLFRWNFFALVHVPRQLYKIQPPTTNGHSQTNCAQVENKCTQNHNINNLVSGASGEALLWLSTRTAKKNGWKYERAHTVYENGSEGEMHKIQTFLFCCSNRNEHDQIDFT